MANAARAMLLSHRSMGRQSLLAGLPSCVGAIPFLSQLPIPAKITTEVLAPIDLSEALGRSIRPEHANDESIVQAGFEIVLQKMREALARLYDERKYPLIG